ncbi:MAG: DUF6452 family protein [Bacteroidales bacterium]
MKIVKEKYMMNREFLLLISLGIIFLLIQCEDDPCEENLNTPVGVTFHTIDTNGVKQDVSITSLSVYALDNDSIIADSSSSVHELKLPLNPHKDSCMFILDADSLQDSITFLYTHDKEFVSQDCGFKLVYELDTIISTGHFIDSLNIIQNTVNKSDENHLEIFVL